jgi:molybdenum cofactor guanylyltransferase
MSKLPVYILAGGKSSRFGSNKALALLDHRPLLVHVAEALKPYASSITVVARVDAEYQDIGYRTIGDIEPDLGPLGGLVTALSDVQASGSSPRILLCACDQILLDPSILSKLFSAQHSDHLAIAFRDQDCWMPFPGIYDFRLIDRIKKQLHIQTKSLQFLLDQVGYAISLPSQSVLIFDCNTQDRLSELRALDRFDRD